MADLSRAVVLAASTLLALTACTIADEPPVADPDRFHQFDDDFQSAVDEASELIEPRNLRRANRHLRFTGDHPMRYVLFETRTEGWITCVEDREAGVYRYEDYADADVTYYGDGECSDDPDDAVVIVEGFVDVVKGADVYRIGD